MMSWKNFRIACNVQNKLKIRSPRQNNCPCLSMRNIFEPTLHCLNMWSVCQEILFLLYPRSPKGGGGILFYLCPSVRPSVRPRYFSSHFSQQLLMTQIWYLVRSFISVPHIVGNVFESIRFLLPVCRLCWFLYTLNIYAHFSSHFSQQILMAEIWYFVTSII